MAHEILVAPFVEINGRDLSGHVRAAGLPLQVRDTVDSTVGTDGAKTYLLTRPTGTWAIRLAADFDVGEVDDVLGGVPDAPFFCRVRRKRAVAAGDNLEYQFAAFLPGYSGFDETELDALLEVGLNFQLTSPLGHLWQMPDGPGIPPNTPGLSVLAGTTRSNSPGDNWWQLPANEDLGLAWTFRNSAGSSAASNVSAFQLRMERGAVGLRGAGFYYYLGGGDWYPDPATEGGLGAGEFCDRGIFHRPSGGWAAALHPDPVPPGTDTTTGKTMRIAGGDWEATVGGGVRQEFSIRTWDQDRFISAWSGGLLVGTL